MIDSQFSLINDNYKQIDDIIDARKKLGQYNVFTQPANSINLRFAYSSSVSDRYVRFEDTMIINDGDYNANIKQTDSEITVVRVKCNGLPERRRSKWDMHDVAIPGDGSHLGESPSLVNLATLVAQTNQNVRSEGKEYLVPLSSWDPYYKIDSDEVPNECWNVQDKNCVQSKLEDEEYLDSSDENSPTASLDATPTGSITSSFLENPETSESDLKGTVARRPSLAGRISNFIRKRYKKTKSLSSNHSSVNNVSNDSDENKPSKNTY